MFLDEVTLVFRLQVNAPAGDRILELAFFVVVAVLEDFDSLGICQNLERMLENEVQFLDEFH